MVLFNRFSKYGAASLVAASQAAALVPINLMMHAANLHAKPDPEQRVSQDKYPNIKSYNWSTPVDHFFNESRYEPHSDDSFPLRYWVDSSNFNGKGPVILLHSGEFDSTGRLPYLQHGIVPILTKETGGIGVILEHRYYGTSFPSIPDLSTENLRFLSTEQALADTAYFAKNIKFPGLEHLNLTAAATPWIIYGGSYAGALAAFTRKLYPDVYWGGISSSGVTAAVEDLWQYFEAARHYAPHGCGNTTQKITHVVDSVLFSGDRAKVHRFKEIFGLRDLEDDDFASTLTHGLHGLQSTNWDPEEDESSLGIYCAVIASSVQLFSSTTHLIPTVRDLVTEAGFAAQSEVLSIQLLNYVGYIRDYVKTELKSACKGKTVLECFSARHTPKDSSLEAGWMRSWAYQVCTQWGYFVTGSGTPKNQLPMISRAITLEYASLHCERLFNITTPPDVQSINKLGGFNFSYPRLAIIDGEQDPWRSATPHASGLPDRESTTSEPFMLIDWGVHHWDEFGLPEDVHVPGLPPPQVTQAHKTEIEFVKAWLKEWEEEKGSSISELDREEEEMMDEL